MACAALVLVATFSCDKRVRLIETEKRLPPPPLSLILASHPPAAPLSILASHPPAAPLSIYHVKKQTTHFTFKNTSRFR